MENCFEDGLGTRGGETRVWKVGTLAPESLSGSCHSQIPLLPSLFSSPLSIPTPQFCKIVSQDVSGCIISLVQCFILRMKYKIVM